MSSCWLQRPVNRLQGLLITGISRRQLYVMENASMLLHLAYDANETSKVSRAALDTVHIHSSPTRLLRALSQASCTRHHAGRAAHASV